MLDHPHWPRDLKLLEEHLAAVRLLKLMLLDLRGQADESQWARILRENHLAHHGQPPPRRLVDGQLVKLP